MSNPFDSPFIVPVAGCVMILGLGISGIYGEIRKRDLLARERVLMIERGVSLAEIERYQKVASSAEKGVYDPLRALSNTRRTMLILLSSGVGVVLLGLLLFGIYRNHDVLVVSAVGLVDVCIGLGFLVDYRMQKREISRFGTELDADLTEPVKSL